MQMIINQKMGQHSNAGKIFFFNETHYFELGKDSTKKKDPLLKM